MFCLVPGAVHFIFLLVQKHIFSTLRVKPLHPFYGDDRQTVENQIRKNGASDQVLHG